MPFVSTVIPIDGSRHSGDPAPSDARTWLRAASRLRVAVASVAATAAGLAGAGIALYGLLNPSLAGAFYWWLLGWGGATVLAALGVQLRITVARPITGLLVLPASLLALSFDALGGFSLDPQDVGFTLGLGLVGVAGLVSFVALGLTRSAVGLALEAFFSR